MYSKVKVRLSDDKFQMIGSNPSFMVEMWESLLMVSRSGKIVSMGLSPIDQCFEIILDQFSIPFGLVRALSRGVFRGCLIEVFVKTFKKIGYIQVAEDGGEYFWFCDKVCLNERNIVAIGFDGLVKDSGTNQYFVIPRSGEEGNAVSFSACPGNLQFDLIKNSIDGCIKFEETVSLDPTYEVVYSNPNPEIANRLFRADREQLLS